MSEEKNRWLELMQKMKEASTKETGDKENKADEYASVLKKRAEILSSSREEKDVGGLRSNILEFQIGNELYALPTKDMSEVIESNNITEIPLTPSVIFGVINLRGRIVTVIDLKNLLELNATGMDDHPSVIIVKYRSELIGILADRIIGTREVNQDEINPPGKGSNAHLKPYILGITSGASVILDIEKLFADPLIGAAQSQTN